MSVKKYHHNIFSLDLLPEAISVWRGSSQAKWFGMSSKNVSTPLLSSFWRELTGQLQVLLSMLISHVEQKLLNSRLSVTMAACHGIQLNLK